MTKKERKHKGKGVDTYYVNAGPSFRGLLSSIRRRYHLFWKFQNTLCSLSTRYTQPLSQKCVKVAAAIRIYILKTGSCVNRIYNTHCKVSILHVLSWRMSTSSLESRVPCINVDIYKVQIVARIFSLMYKTTFFPF